MRRPRQSRGQQGNPKHRRQPGGAKPDHREHSHLPEDRERHGRQSGVGEERGGDGQGHGGQDVAAPLLRVPRRVGRAARHEQHAVVHGHADDARAEHQGHQVEPREDQLAQAQRRHEADPDRQERQDQGLERAEGEQHEDDDADRRPRADQRDLAKRLLRGLRRMEEDARAQNLGGARLAGGRDGVVESLEQGALLRDGHAGLRPAPPGPRRRSSPRP